MRTLISAAVFVLATGAASAREAACVASPTRACVIGLAAQAMKSAPVVPNSPGYEVAYARLEHVIKTYQKEILKEKKPIAVDFSQMKTITINEDAHGHD